MSVQKAHLSIQFNSIVCVDKVILTLFLKTTKCTNTGQCMQEMTARVSFVVILYKTL